MTTPEITRRTALKASAWSVPVLAAAVAVPMQAASAGVFVVKSSYWDTATNTGIVELTAVGHFVDHKDIAYGGYTPTNPAVQAYHDPDVVLPGYELRFMLSVKPGFAPPTETFNVDFGWIRWFPPLSVPVPFV